MKHKMTCPYELCHINCAILYNNAYTYGSNKIFYLSLLKLRFNNINTRFLVDFVKSSVK